MTRNGSLKIHRDGANARKHTLLWRSHVRYPVSSERSFVGGKHLGENHQKLVIPAENVCSAGIAKGELWHPMGTEFSDGDLKLLGYRNSQHFAPYAACPLVMMGTSGKDSRLQCLNWLDRCDRGSSSVAISQGLLRESV
jgi:hypothetical protein